MNDRVGLRDLVVAIVGTAIIVALVAALCPAADLPPWPEQVEPGSFLLLDLPANSAVIVTAVDPGGEPFQPQWRKADKETEPFVAVETKPGVLTVELELTAATRGLRKFMWSILVGEGAGPQPSPNPTPTPQPTRIFGVLVEETDDRDEYTQEQVNAITDTADAEYMAAKGFPYRKVDQDVVEPDGQGGDRVPLSIASFLQRAKSQKLPRLIISDQTGTVVYDDVVTGPVLPILKQYGGE